MQLAICNLFISINVCLEYNINVFEYFYLMISDEKNENRLNTAYQQANILKKLIRLLYCRYSLYFLSFTWNFYAREILYKL